MAKAVDGPVLYILVALSGMSAVLSAVFFFAWKTLGEKPWALSWSIACMCAASQWFFSLTSSWFPSYEAYWLTVSAFAVMTLFLGLKGHIERTNSPRLPKNIIPYALPIYAVIVWTLAFDQHLGVTTAVVPFTAGIALFLSAFVIYDQRRKTRTTEHLVAGTLILVGLAQIGASVAAFAQGPDGNVVYRDLYYHITFLSLPIGYTALSILKILMMAEDRVIETEEESVLDDLTGVMNRRGFRKQAQQAFLAAIRNEEPMSLIMADIDKFKTINDRYGHSTGDAALVEFAQTLSKDRDEGELVARIGGEEFIIMLPETKLDDALQVAEELCKAVDDKTMIFNGLPVSITASFGVASLSANDTFITDIVGRADQALYRSKHAGRNRVDLESSQLYRTENGSFKKVSV